MPTGRELADALGDAEAILEELKNAVDEIEGLEDKLDKIEELQEKIRRARQDPDALDEPKYGELMGDLLLLLPFYDQLPDRLKKIIGKVLELIGNLFEFYLKFFLNLRLKEFWRRVKAYGDDEDAARRAAKELAPVGQHYLWLLGKWKASRRSDPKEEKEEEKEQEEKEQEEKENQGGGNGESSSKVPPDEYDVDPEKWIAYMLALLFLIRDAERKKKEEDLTPEEKKHLQDWIDHLWRLFDKYSPRR